MQREELQRQTAKLRDEEQHMQQQSALLVSTLHGLHQAQAPADPPKDV